MKRKLIWRYIRKSDRWGRAVALSVLAASVLVIGLLNIWISFYGMLKQDVVQKSGSYHVMLRNMDEFQLDTEKLDQFDDECERSGRMSLLAEVTLDGIGGEKAEESFSLSLEAVDPTAFELCAYPLKQGRLPEHEREIAISCGIAVGQDYIYRRIPIGSDVVIGGKTYKITGYLNDFVAGQEEKVYHAVTYASRIETPTTVYFEFSGDIQAKLNGMLDCFGLSAADVYDEGDLFGAVNMEEEKEGCAVVTNADLITLQRKGPSNLLNRTIFYGILFVVLAIVIFAVIIIVHIQGICFQKRREQMGMLRLCGMSRGGIFALICGESMLSGIVMMGVGTFAAYALEQLIFRFVQQRRSFALENFQVSVSVPATLAGMAVLFLVLLLSSTVVCLKICGEPLVANVGWTPVSPKHTFWCHKKLRRSGLGLSVRMASRFLFSNPVRSLFCVLSMTVSIVMVIVFMCFTESLQQKAERNIFTPLEQYGIFSNEFRHLDELLEKMPYVETCRMCFGALVEVELDESKYLNPDEFYARERLTGDGARLCDMGGINKEFFDDRIRFVDGNEMTYEEWVESGTCLVGDFFYENGKCRRLTRFQKGDTVTYRGNNDEFGSYEGHTLTVGGVVQLEQYNRNMDGEWGCVYYLPLEHLDQYIAASDEGIRLNAKPGKEAALGEWLDQNQEYYDYYINDDVTEYMQANDTRSTVKSGLLAVAALILLLCILNSANSQVAEFEARKDDYRILHLLGGGRGQFVRVILLEQAVLLVISMLAGIGVSILVIEKILAGLLKVESVRVGFPLFYIMCAFWIHAAAAFFSMMPILYRICRSRTFRVNSGDE